MWSRRNFTLQHNGPARHAPALAEGKRGDSTPLGGIIRAPDRCAARKPSAACWSPFRWLAVVANRKRRCWWSDSLTTTPIEIVALAVRQATWVGRLVITDNCATSFDPGRSYLLRIEWPTGENGVEQK